MTCKLIHQSQNKFLAPECCLSDFSETSLHFIVYLQTLQNMTCTTVTFISQTKHHLSSIDHPLCQIGSILPCKMETVYLVTATRLQGVTANGNCCYITQCHSHSTDCYYCKRVKSHTYI